MTRESMLFNLWVPKLKNRSDNEEVSDDDNIAYTDAIKIVKQKRQDLGYSIKELSKRTMISTNVIKSIENGLIMELPEKTYLTSMLRRLEVELNIEEGSLKNIIKKDTQQKINQSILINNKNNSLFIHSWKGIFAYIIVIMTCILILNKYQRHLSIINSQTINPVKIEPIKGDKE